MEFIKPNIFISKCIEHDNCRYDNSMITSEIIRRFIPFVNFIYSCPEMDIGLSSPREALRIVVSEDKEKSLIFSKSGMDVTDKMYLYSEKKSKELKEYNLDGFILKGRSPSCGNKDVKMYKGYGKSPIIPGKTSGIFGEVISEEFNLFPIEDEGRLRNFSIREHFFTRIFTTAKYRGIKTRGEMKDLIKFHSNNKYLFMAYNQKRLKNLGKIVANHENKNVSEVYQNYEKELLELLKTPSSKKRKMNVAFHILGYFSKDLKQKEKAYFLELIDEYMDNQIPFSTIASIFEVWSIRFDIDYLIEQSLFNPFPKELITTRDSGKEV